MSRPALAPRPLLLAALVAGIAVPAALHLDYLLRDQRLPRDLGLFYLRVPAMWAALHGQAGADWPQPGGAGAWYELFLAGWLSLVGRSPQAFQLVDLAALVALLALCGAAAAAVTTGRGAGPVGAGRVRAAALAAVLLAGGTPWLVLRARLSWIHVPEAALVLATALPWLRDPALGRGSLRTAVLGALVLLLRPTGLAWLLPLGLGLVLGRDGRRPPARRLLGIGLCWLLAALPALLGLRDYLLPKVAARGRYAMDVPGLGPQLLDALGPLLPLVAVAGLVLLLRRRRDPAAALLLSWLLLPVALWLGFRAGLDNFLVGFAALAILAGAGLAAWPRGGPLLAALPFLLLHLPRLLPDPPPDSALDRALTAIGEPAQADLHQLYRPQTEWGRADLDALLAASCPRAGRCVLGVAEGLDQPYGEEAGRLGTFLRPWDRLDLLDLRGQGPPPPLRRLHALIRWDCPSQQAAWARRFPGQAVRVQRAVRQHDLRVAWQRRVAPECTVSWLVPHGQLVDPSALPAGDPR